MPTYKFKYFNARGFGEISRLLFALAGQEYEDVRFTREEWPAEKPKTPFGVMPILEIDGKPYCQSSAIARYLAKTFGFYGKDNIEALIIDTVMGILQDIYSTLMKAHFETDETKKAELIRENREEKLPNYLGMFEKILRDNGGSGRCVGDKISLGDIAIFDVCGTLKDLVDLSKFPLVKKCQDLVGSNPRIKAWVEKRPVTER